MQLPDIDSGVIFYKHERSIRNRKEYRTLQTMAREGCNEKNRPLFWKKAIGVSKRDMQSYEKWSKGIFEGIAMQDFPQFPMFGSKCRFKTLSPEKKYCARKILVVLAVEHDSLRYCPQIPRGGQKKKETVVKHVDEATAFGILNAMVEVSKKNHWYFRTDFFQFRVGLRAFLDLFADQVKAYDCEIFFFFFFFDETNNSKKKKTQNKTAYSNMTQRVVKHINDHNIAIEKVLAEGLVTLYVNFLNEKTLLRLIDIFFVEGYQVLFRVGLALLKNAEESLLQEKKIDTFRKVLIEKSRRLNPVQLCNLAKQVTVSRTKLEKLETLHQATLQQSSRTDEQVARRWPSWNPKWVEQSNILKHKADFLQLWVWLPPKCHIGDFQLLFNTSEDGYQLATLYEKCYDRQNLLVLIQTTTGESFGFHVSSLHDAPRNQRFVDMQILTFLLEYPNDRLASKQVFEPPHIHFDYLRNQPMRTMSLLSLNPQKSESESLRSAFETQQRYPHIYSMPISPTAAPFSSVQSHNPQKIAIDSNSEFNLSRQNSDIAFPKSPLATPLLHYQSSESAK
ncbi:RabGAP/TBC domain-containing protein, partial [Reticulomyxa filosa]